MSDGEFVNTQISDWRFNKCNIGGYTKEFAKYYANYPICVRTISFNNYTITLQRCYNDFCQNCNSILIYKPYFKELVCEIKDISASYQYTELDVHEYNCEYEKQKKYFYYSMCKVEQYKLMSILYDMDKILTLFEKIKMFIGNKSSIYLDNFVAKEFYKYYQSVKDDIDKFKEKVNVETMDTHHDEVYNFLILTMKERYTDFISENELLLDMLEPAFSTLNGLERSFLNYLVSMYLLKDNYKKIIYNSDDYKEISSLFNYKFKIILFNQLGVIKFFCIKF